MKANVKIFEYPVGESKPIVHEFDYFNKGKEVQRMGNKKFDIVYYEEEVEINRYKYNQD